MSSIRTAMSPRVRVFCDAGDPELPIFALNDQGEVIDTGKKKNTDKEIQSHKDEVLLSKIIERCGFTGETLIAPPECFGDASQLPKDLLDAHQKGQQVQRFVDSLDDNQLNLLNEKGFDALVLSVLEKKKEAADSAASEVKKDE